MVKSVPAAAGRHRHDGLAPQQRLQQHRPGRLLQQQQHARHRGRALAAMAAVRLRRPAGARAGRRTGDHRRQRRPDRRAPATGPGSQRRLPRLYRARARTVNARQGLVNAGTLLDAANARYRQGQGTVVEVAQATQNREQARLATVTADSAEQDAYLALITAMGISPLAQPRIATLPDHALSPALAQPVEQIITDALARRPDVLAAYAAEQARNRRARRTRTSCPRSSCPRRPRTPRGARPSPPCPPSASRPAPSTWTAAVPAPASSWA